MSLAVAGTDTDVGKTVLSGLLLARGIEREQPLAYLKPIGCGGKLTREGDQRVRINDDVLFLRRLLPPGQTLTEANPVCFRAYLSPLAASFDEKLRVSLPRLKQSLKQLEQRYGSVVVEPAGGVMVPLTWRLTNLDLLKAFNLPVVLVAHAGLGTLNHTLLSARALGACGLRLQAIFLNTTTSAGKAKQGNRVILRRLCGCPVHFLPRLAGLDEIAWERAAARLGKALDPLLRAGK